MTQNAQAIAVEWNWELQRTSPIDLRRQTSVKAVTTSTGATITATVDADYASLVSEGTRPHTILPKKQGGVLVFQIGGRTIFTARVSHPGARPNPWWTDSIKNLPSLIRRMWA